MAYFIGIDLGGTLTKAGVYDAEGQEMAVAEKNVPLLSEHPGFAERNMEDLWLAVCEVTQSAIAQSQIAKHQVKGISFSSHGKGLYLLDRHNQPLRNGIVSSDTRAATLVSDWQKNGVEDRTYPNSRQQIWTGQPVSLLAWLKEHEPENYQKIDTVLMVHDYIRFMMTGEKGAELTNISGSNLYDNHTNQYSEQLASAFGVSDILSSLPPTVESSEHCGSVTLGAARALGLNAGTPVFGGLFDVVASAIASGLNDNQAISIAAGTWSIATTLSKWIEPSDHHYIWGRYCTKDTYFVHEGSPTSASNLAWWRQHLLPDVSLQQCNQWVEQAQKQNTEEVYYLPYLYGSNGGTGLHGSLIGLQGHHGKQEVINAIYEGIVFSHLINQDRILKITPNAKRIKMTGGPTKSQVWVNMFASASQLPIEISSTEQEGCHAAALCAAVGGGHYKDFNEAISATHTPGKLVEPEPKQSTRLREKFQHFQELNAVLSGPNTTS
ncbi:FGGY-family carbohydrate kinase [Vibrio nigripulchritudo]|uniref:FGGY-family carbohydrate kinase n=1 Tax=Vibrio nigripulchritudo TaxID=28173 RepID=UPI0005F9CE82|nr:FGGY-family carbohydrate kinase [Vibrio nigripulchritudo]KJY74761.1 3-keto-L-gulonate kinase [Vibrio nigripulchritudo]